MNTVNFSNHSGKTHGPFYSLDSCDTYYAGYGRFGGSRATAEELSNIFSIMEQNELLVPERLLTGYVPGAEATAAVTGLAKTLRERKPDLIYLLDRMSPCPLGYITHAEGRIRQRYSGTPAECMFPRRSCPSIKPPFL